MLISSLILHNIKDVEASSNETISECKTLAYIGIMLTILSLIIVLCKAVLALNIATYLFIPFY